MYQYILEEGADPLFTFTTKNGLKYFVVFMKVDLQKNQINMTKLYGLDDDGFYKLLNLENQEFYTPIKTAFQVGLKPHVKILQSGHNSSWYNIHIGKIYEIYKYVIETKNGYINFLVKSKDDGTKKGYKIPFLNYSMGKGIDIVHNISCEIIIVMSK